MIDADALTSEQRAVVHHRGGPAAVLAVPGAGKTTAVAHRVRCLVEERGVAPERILVSSFNRATVRELETRLEALGVRGVEARTLHGLGHAVLRRAGETDNGRASPSPKPAAYRLARRALQDRADAHDQHPHDLDVTVEAVVDQVAAWKQQLAYVSPSEAPVPSDARTFLQRAEHENEVLVDLFRRFEAHRRETGWWTYPDLLRDGWATLVRDDALREQMQDAYAHVIVDEFQDVGRAQYYLLDLLTAPDRNYLVVGDDDQSIYRWRGADPSYLRTFADRYEGQEYWMQTSFRLPAEPLVLANAVIAENEERHPKRMHLTQGFTGAVTRLRGDDPTGVADQLAEEVVRLQSETGLTLDDMVVLVRTYAQTPLIEQALTARNLPYRVRGHDAFYRRRPAQTLLQYLYWAVLEDKRRRQEGFDDPTIARRYSDRFTTIINHPNRYVARPRVDLIARRARETGQSVLALLETHRPRMPDDTAEHVDDFLRAANHLVDRIDAPPRDTLAELVNVLDYETVLRDRSATAVQGDLQVRTVEALLRFAATYSSASALLRGVQTLAKEHNPDAASPVLDLRSIHRAKGAEWPAVFVPDCNDGILPLASESPGDRDVAEERRLFYVALTRTQQRLYLGVSSDRSPSRFLEEAAPDRLRLHCKNVRDALPHPPHTLSDRACARLCQSITALSIEQYVKHWWTPSLEHATALLHRLDDVADAMETAQKRREDYRTARAEHHAALDALEDAVQSDVQTLRDRLGTASLPATLDTDTHLPTDARLQFQEPTDSAAIQVLWQEQIVGRVDPFSAQLDAGLLLDLPWPHLVAQLDRVRRSRGVLRFAIDWPATQRQMLADRRKALSAPEPLDDETRLLSSDAVRSGYGILRARLSALLDAEEKT
jgi:DNA helicase-2/ATP-dependent DNA helicase PcrA